jgi:hypothetical protein
MRPQTGRLSVSENVRRWYTSRKAGTELVIMNRWVPLIIAALLGLSVPALAGPEVESAPPPSGDNAAELPGTVIVDNTWVDRFHTYIEQDMYGTVAWFDHFFEDELRKDAGRTSSSLRWTNDFRWDQQQDFTYRTVFRASIRLSHLSGKWRLVISGENTGDPTALKPVDPGNPGVAVAAEDRRGSTELVYEALRTQRTIVDLGAGVRIKIPPSVYVRTRYMHARELAYGVIGRLYVTPYWEASDGFGESNEIDLERHLAPETLLRWANSATITEQSNGWVWGTEVAILHRLSPKSAITFAGGATGPTRPSTVVGNYRVYARYRRNFKRDWLFFELEPDVNWPRQDDGSHKTVWGGTFRLEVNFQGKQR